MGNYAVFIARCEEGKESEVCHALSLPNNFDCDFRNVRIVNKCGLVLGEIKSSYPGGAQAAIGSLDQVIEYSIMGGINDEECDYDSRCD